MESFSFNPATTAANTSIAVPAEFQRMARLVAVDVVNMSAAPAATIKEVPQNDVTTGTGESYLVDQGHIMVGDAVTVSEYRIYVTAVMLGEEPYGYDVSS